MQLHTRELQDFVRGSLVIDCGEMVLTSNNKVHPAVYKGCGSVWQTDDGHLTFKLYCSRRLAAEEIWEVVGSYAAGEVVPDSAFFSLYAVDINGQAWRGARILPNLTSGEAGTVISADLQDLSTQTELRCSTPRVRMLLGFNQPVKFPCNVVTKIETTVAGAHSGTSAALNKARFSACGYEFTVQNEGDWLELNVSASGTTIPDYLDTRICEALQFVLARQLVWSFREVYEENKRLTIFRPSGRSETDQPTRPPIALGQIDQAGFTWSLFDKYLQHVINYEKEDKLHPLSAWVRSVIAATFSALESQALAISVAIEGILDLELQHLGPSSNTVEKEIQTATSLVRGSADLSEPFKRRVYGSLRAMRHPRAKDKLMELFHKGLIEEELLNAWKKTRDSAAHGGLISFSSSPGRTSELLNHCLAVNQLFNNLVFLAIGYTGKYTDYSAHDWPLKDFERAVKTDDDLSVDVSGKGVPDISTERA